MLYREPAPGKAGLDEQCFLDPRGTELGCGTSRDGAPWNGTFVDWQLGGPGGADGSMPPLKEMRSYHDGKPDGVWRSFQPDGTLLVETTYKDGVMTSRQSARNGEMTPLPSQAHPPLDVPVNRRPHPTYVP